MDLTILEDGTRIIHVNTPELVEKWRDGFAASYPIVFTGPPYFEELTPDDAYGVWDKLIPG